MKKDNKFKPNNNNKKKVNFSLNWIYLILIAIFLSLFFTNTGSNAPEEIGWGELKSIIEDQDVEKIILVNKEYAEIFIKKDSISKSRYSEDGKQKKYSTSNPQYKIQIASVENFEKDVREAQEGFETVVYPIAVTRKSWGSDFLPIVLPFIIIIVLWIVIMRYMSRGAGGGGGAIFNVGKSKAQLFDKDTSVKINFSDVAGLEEAKIEVMEIVDFLKNPKKYTRLGGKIPKGALLVGPPGTGKTLLAKAVAGEAQVPFFSLSGSDFVEMFVGVGASRVRDLFKQAKEKAPSIIFIDEIDAVGRARGRSSLTGANDERESTLNQLLTEMDGFQTNTGVIILAATNRADVLDRALLRAGRFDRQIYIELPELEERKAIFKVHTKGIKTDDTVDINFLAKQTPGFSGADIANVCNEAALIAARANKDFVGKQDFLDAVDRIVGGLEKRSKIISPKEKKVIAYHESGHATVSWLCEHAHPLIKVTIVPRGKALGAAWYLPEERQLTTYNQMYDEITSALGGRAAEEVVFGEISTGALNDLEKVTKQAYAMVAYFGLNEKIGNLSFYDSSGQQEYSFNKPFSEETAKIIDQEISKLVEGAYQRAKQILIDNREKLDMLANKLLEKEVIFRDDLEEIFGKRPFDEEDEVVQEAEVIEEQKDLKTEGIASNDDDSISEEKQNVSDEISETDTSDTNNTDS